MANKLCLRCQYLDFESLTRDELPRSHPITYTLGPVLEIASRQEQCDFCLLVIKTLSSTWKQSLTVTVDGQQVSCTLSNRAVGVILPKDAKGYKYSENFAYNNFEYSNCRIIIKCNTAPVGCSRNAEIQPVGDKIDIHGLFDNAPLFSRRSKDQLLQIDFKLLENWVSYCRKHHGAECKPESFSSNRQDSYIPSFRLIDVTRDCVCNAKADWSYVALSYVWGQSPMLKLLQANKAELYTEGALSTDNQSIPQTIRDAIFVTKQLGEKYLWVDALCITQDDIAEKAKVIGEMDLIYSRADLTIVAAFGNDAGAGLAGMRPGTRSLEPYEHKISIKSESGSKELMVARSRPSQIIDDSKWNSRGWTYQERLLSHRMLLFTEEQVLYWCGKNLWCEDTVLETSDDRVHYEDTPLYRFRLHNSKDVAFMKQFEEAPQISIFEEYAKIVSEYCHRNLSFEGDVLDAFAGLLRSFKASYDPKPNPLEYYFGLPSIWFELSLMWTPPAGSNGLRRRTAEFRDSSGANIRFPSWSWTGWTGQIYYKYPQSLEASTRSEIKWYLSDVYGSVISIPIYEGPKHPAPHWFQSSSEPRRLREKWKPAAAPTDVPSKELTNSTTKTPFNAHLLIFYTSCGYLPIEQRLGGLVTPGSENSRVREYFIGGEGKGHIELDSEWVASHPRAQYEFIVIARSLQSDWQDPGMMDYLKVMLIERSGDIAFRVGVGAVPESTWVSAVQLEWKLVKLG